MSYICPTFEMSTKRNTSKTQVMTHNIKVINEVFDIYVKKVSHGTYEWTLVTDVAVLLTRNNNAQHYDIWIDRMDMTYDEVLNIKKEIALNIAIPNGYGIIFEYSNN